MSDRKYTRRDFLKLSALGLSSLAFRPFFNPGEGLDNGETVRVAIDQVSIHSQPWDESRILYQRYRDDLLNVYETVVSDKGPGYNPVWYRVWGGYVHSAHMQTVKMILNPVIDKIPGKRLLAEVTVPFTTAYRDRKQYGGWEQLYRLYYQSVHWVVGIEPGPDGEPSYRLRDELLEIEYNAPAAHFRIIPPEEFAPISPHVKPEKKRIEVSIVQQTLTAYEEDKVVLHTKISSGLLKEVPAGMVPTKTPTGTFNIQSKMPSKHMGDGNLTAQLDAYELPGVPWVCFFEPKTGVATHGTYWHTNHGVPMSHGCINMKTEEARWIYRWTTPVAGPEDVEKIGYGTQVIVS
jgi:hypothetical protein